MELTHLVSKKGNFPSDDEIFLLMNYVKSLHSQDSPHGVPLWKLIVEIKWHRKLNESLQM